MNQIITKNEVKKLHNLKTHENQFKISKNFFKHNINRPQDFETEQLVDLSPHRSNCIHTCA